MKTFEEMEYHPTAEKLVGILCEKTQNPNTLFFRVHVAYYLCLIASMMRVSITTHDRGEIPVNMYALNLGTSGSGKGFSTNIMENSVINRFRARFMENTFPLLAEMNLPKISLRRANRKGNDPDEELIRVQKEFDEPGPLVFSFDSGTSAAVKQLRHKLLMADAGSMNLQIDEVGTNLLGNIEVLGTFLELFDVGKIKSKLIKNTSENKRSEEIVGATPTNMMLFGTPSKLLDGAKVEEELYSMLETGFARRCFFGYSRAADKAHELTPEQVYDMLTNQASNVFLEEISEKMENLADILNANKKLVMSKDTSVLLIEYRLKCERLAMELPEHEEIKKAEISHRYFKALKLAGAYAFLDDSPELTEAHLYQAIKLAEESGMAFNRLMTRDRPYVKLAKYLGSVRRDVTQADLVEDLPFYKGAASQKQEMLSLAIAWAYKNNIIIKKAFSDGIEFLRGEMLDVTDLSKTVVAYSTDITEGYRNEHAPFDQLHKLAQSPGLHWTSHHLLNGYRNEENAIPGFNLLVIDVDGDVKMDVVRELLKDYTFMMYTTKRHQATVGGVKQGDRFRVVLPINYTLKMDPKDYKEFMSNIYEWLPFDVDTSTGQRSRKWLSCAKNLEGVPSQVVYNEGQLFDALPFIPKTSKNEERQNLLKDQAAMDKLERWVMNNIGDGNRNNMLLRYGMILVDAGMDVATIQQKVMSLNDKIADKLDDAEIYNTIMISIAKAVAKRVP